MTNSNPDKEKFVALIRANKGIIFRICNSYCDHKEDLDDLSQEIVYNLWKSFRNYNQEFKFTTWMYRIALNVAISFYRKENKSRPHLSISENLLEPAENMDTDSNEDPNLTLLLKFIAELKEIDKSIMLLCLDDKSYKEISEITGITETNVSTKINRIKDKLRSKFLTNQKSLYGTT